MEFLSSVSSKYGFVFRKTKEGGAEIEVHKNYIIACTINGNLLKMVWKPKLSEKLMKKYKVMFPEVKKDIKKK